MISRSFLWYAAGCGTTAPSEVVLRGVTGPMLLLPTAGGLAGGCTCSGCLTSLCAAAAAGGTAAAGTAVLGSAPEAGVVVPTGINTPVPPACRGLLGGLISIARLLWAAADCGTTGTTALCGAVLRGVTGPMLLADTGCVGGFTSRGFLWAAGGGGGTAALGAAVLPGVLEPLPLDWRTLVGGWISRGRLWAAAAAAARGGGGGGGGCGFTPPCAVGLRGVRAVPWDLRLVLRGVVGSTAVGRYACSSEPRGLQPCAVVPRGL